MSRKKTTASLALSQALRLVRSERGHSQESLAAHAHIDRSYYGAIERGEFNVSLKTLVTLATALETSVADLLARAGL
jgi:transcriptional regulator with XRE-family HTH domain